ncbi:hypothetical protein F2Q68_00028379 [Brassica cretica]|uniref:6,7-dimethyl-8-ribityllumazine synthase n=1 Tax=Brassica cretica TaxID=69181 RepID=A0A8S9ICL7_BRACR|nr:hypothetical protein F2Q68_00028379 [Brassica cretica]
MKSLASPPCLRLTPTTRPHLHSRQSSSTVIKSNSLSFSSSASGFASPLAVEKELRLETSAVRHVTGSLIRGEGLRFAIVIWVPGSVLCIGAVIRGDTTHYVAISGVLSAGINSGVPCIFGVLTCEDMDQALNPSGSKAGNKGAETSLTPSSVFWGASGFNESANSAQPLKALSCLFVAHRHSSNSPGMSISQNKVEIVDRDHKEEEAIGFGVPCIFGVLTCEDMDQALNRSGGKAGNKGAETALTALEMASLFEHHLK